MTTTRIVLAATLAAAWATAARYEREADWLALRDGDAAGALQLFRRFAALSRSDPDPPGLWHALTGTHPTLAERVALTRAAAPRASPRSP